jgi:hypothetical protein
MDIFSPAGASAKAADGDVIEKAPHAREADHRRHDPPHQNGRYAKARAQETEERVDVDVLTASGRQGCAQHGKPPGELGADAAQAAEEGEP